jgi:hypothetical protein
MLMAAQQSGRPSSMSGDIGSLLEALFSRPGEPYQKASDILSQYFPQAQGYLNPFLQAGQGAIPQYQNWLNTMKDPSGFINNLMGKYQESPYAKFAQQQAMRSAQNMGSASGLTGSTPLMQFAQQNAQNISSQDMNQWLQNVLGVNTQYGQGEFGLMNQGMEAGNSLTNLMQNYMNNQAGLAYGKDAAQQGRTGNIIQDIANFF